MGLIFLRHAYSRFLGGQRRDRSQAAQARRQDARTLTKEDFSQRGAIFLRPKAQFDYLVALPDSDDRGQGDHRGDGSDRRRITKTSRRAAQERNIRSSTTTCSANCCARSIPDELKRASGDVFGRIYEYFLTQFSEQGAHDNGEFFTPLSHRADDRQRDRAGSRHGARSGLRLGRHVRAERAISSRMQARTRLKRVTFYGQEKNETTIRLAQDEPRGPRPGRATSEQGDHLLQGPARTASASATS